MRFGVREICNVVFKPLTSVDIGNQHFDAYQPVLYIDTATTSSLEGASSTVYAQGGQGNPRLIGWDGEKTLTFTLEDALMSATSFALLSGAGIIHGEGAANDNVNTEKKVYTHTTYDLVIEKYDEEFYAVLPQDIRDGASIVVSKEAPVYATTLDSAGAPKHILSSVSDAEIFEFAEGKVGNKAATLGARGIIKIDGDADLAFKLTPSFSGNNQFDSATAPGPLTVGDAVRIDCYTVHGAGAQRLQIDAESFAGYYYIEADTLFRDEATGKDFPAEFVIPRGKIQTNFTFTMAASGDPSTFTFTIDCFPAYTKFDKSHKVLAELQIIDPSEDHHNYADKSIYGHAARTDDAQAYSDNIYERSIFAQVESSNADDSGSGDDSGESGSGDDSGESGSGDDSGESGSGTTNP